MCSCTCVFHIGGDPYVHLEDTGEGISFASSQIGIWVRGSRPGQATLQSNRGNLFLPLPLGWCWLGTSLRNPAEPAARREGLVQATEPAGSRLGSQLQTMDCLSLCAGHTLPWQHRSTVYTNTGATETR